MRKKDFDGLTLASMLITLAAIAILGIVMNLSDYKFVSNLSVSSDKTNSSLERIIPKKIITESQKPKIIADVIKKLDKGQIRYNLPKEMTVGKSDIIDVLIIASETENIHKYSIKGNGDSVVESIKVSSVMQVDLTGSKFNIKPLFSNKEKLVTDTSSTTWRWKITPKKVGYQRLTLTVMVNIEIPGYEDEILPYEYKVFDKDITVKVNTIYSVKEFLKTNWRWVIITIACFKGIPLFLGNWKNIKVYIYKLLTIIRIILKKVRKNLTKRKFSNQK